MAPTNRRTPGAPLVVSILLALSVVALWNGWATGQLNIWQSAPWTATDVTVVDNGVQLKSLGCRGAAPLDGHGEAWLDIGLPDGIHVMVVKKDGDVLITPPGSIAITGGALQGPAGMATFTVEPSLQYGGRAVRIHGVVASTTFVTITCTHGP